MLLTSGRAKAFATELLIPQDMVIQLPGPPSQRASHAGHINSSHGAPRCRCAENKFGRAMRATSQDLEAAEYMGVNTSRVIAGTFILGSALAGTGGSDDWSLLYTSRLYDRFSAGMKAFTAAVLGGIGSFHGAMVGGILLGLAESFGCS